MTIDYTIHSNTFFLRFKRFDIKKQGSQQNLHNANKFLTWPKYSKSTLLLINKDIVLGT